MNETDEIGLLSHEVQELLGKKFSWVIRNGNLILFLALMAFFFMSFIIRIPTYQTINSRAIKKKHHYQASFQIQQTAIQYLQKNTTLHIQTVGFIDVPIGAKIESLKRIDANFYVVNVSFESQVELPNNLEIEISIPTNQKRLIDLLISKLP
jgi:hypothetical protein